MKYQTHNDKDCFGGGGSLVGTATVSYAKLKELFGKPTDSDGYKSDAEWEVEFEDGTKACIYNWKDGKNYNGKSGLGKTKITDWHIGGESQRAVDLVKMAINGEAVREAF